MGTHDSIVARRIQGTVLLYSAYLSVLTVWISLCAAAVFAYTSLMFGDFFLGATFCAALIADRVIDESNVFCFSRATCWLVLELFADGASHTSWCGACGTAAPRRFLCHSYRNVVIVSYFRASAMESYNFSFCRGVKKTVAEQGLYSAASQARRVGDKLIAVPLLGADLAFTYNIYAQIASGVVLMFDKAFNIIERLSYLKRQTERIIINRAPFILTSCLAIALASTWQEASNSVTLTLIVLSIFFWSLAIVDRELDYMWWSGQKNVVRLSFFTSIFWGLSLSFCLVIDLHITQLTQLTFSLVIMATMVSMALYMRSQIK